MPEPAAVPSGFAAGVTAALAETPDADPRRLWQALGRHGVLTALFTAGDRFPRADRVGELLAALDARLPVGTVLSVCVQVATALPILREHSADRPDLRTVTEAALAGRSMLALAATDAHGAGSDLMSLATTATLTGDRVVLSGGKQWITNACTADHALVLARHSPRPHFTSFLWVLVPMDRPGVRATPAPTGLFDGAGVGSIDLDEVSLDRAMLVGSPGRGLPTFLRHVTTERLAGGLWAAAICRRVLAGTREALAGRPLAGGSVWDAPAVQHRFARCLQLKWQIEAACTQLLAAPPSTAMVQGMLLKATVAQNLDAVLGECGQLLGSRAFETGGVAQLRAETAMFGIAGGASGAMLAGIADHAADLLA
ncbi:MAG TPA: acyl-CoA dehydrogenase family protein [Jatrophihabitans sp.]|nr:acyl-CoA dehydrogenase family protein [Jatrophihabitans sp.]